jgi:L-asparaginase / beta-aspartyl-peptidase
MKYCLAVHGGAGTIAQTGADEEPYHRALQAALQAGQMVLAQQGSAQAAVVAAVQVMEDCPLFNAGCGSVYTADAKHEMDACLMDGLQLRAGAVTAVWSIKNPILLAQAVLQESGCVLLAAEGAERFARDQGFTSMPPEYFANPTRLAQLLRVQSEAGGLPGGGGGGAGVLGGATAAGVLDHDGAAAPLHEAGKMGTVGAVARDCHGNLAAATSTGGLTNKRPGRVGDTPLVGAGCYADNQTVAVSTTGTGEAFMRTVLAYDIAARVLYGGQTLDQACQGALEKLAAVGGRGGLIAIDRVGNILMPFNTLGMYRAWVKQGETGRTAIFAA